MSKNRTVGENFQLAKSHHPTAEDNRRDFGTGSDTLDGRNLHSLSRMYKTLLTIELNG